MSFFAYLAIDGIGLAKDNPLYNTKNKKAGRLFSCTFLCFLNIKKESYIFVFILIYMLFFNILLFYSITHVNFYRK